MNSGLELQIKAFRKPIQHLIDFFEKLKDEFESLLGRIIKFGSVH